MSRYLLSKTDVNNVWEGPTGTLHGIFLAFSVDCNEFRSKQEECYGTLPMPENKGTTSNSWYVGVAQGTCKPTPLPL